MYPTIRKQKKGEETHVPNSFSGDLNQIQKPKEVLRFTTTRTYDDILTYPHAPCMEYLPTFTIVFLSQM